MSRFLLTVCAFGLLLSFASAQEKQPTERPLSVADWKSQIKELIERNKRYPDSAPRDEERVVKVLFSLDRRGRVMDSRIISSSGSSVLDEEALALVRRSEPFPPTPQELKDRVDLALPIRFKPTSSISLDRDNASLLGNLESYTYMCRVPSDHKSYPLKLDIDNAMLTWRGRTFRNLQQVDGFAARSAARDKKRSA